MKRSLVIATFAFSLFALAPAALALDPSVSNPQPGSTPINPQPGSTPGTTLINPLNTGSCTGTNGECLSAFLNKILDFVITIGSIVVMLMLVFVGFKFVTARGEPGELTKAKDMLLWTIIGALILIGAKAIAVGITATVQALSVGQ